MGAPGWMSEFRKIRGGITTLHDDTGFAMVSLCDTEKYHPSLNNVIDKSKDVINIRQFVILSLDIDRVT